MADVQAQGFKEEEFCHHPQREKQPNNNSVNHPHLILGSYGDFKYAVHTTSATESESAQRTAKNLDTIIIEPAIEKQANKLLQHRSLLKQLTIKTFVPNNISKEEARLRKMVKGKEEPIELRAVRDYIVNVLFNSDSAEFKELQKNMKLTGKEEEAKQKCIPRGQVCTRGGAPEHYVVLTTAIFHFLRHSAVIIPYDIVTKNFKSYQVQYVDRVNTLYAVHGCPLVTIAQPQWNWN